MINICRNVLAALITAVSLSAGMRVSFPTLNDFKIFDEILLAYQSEFNYTIYLCIFKQNNLMGRCG